MRWSGKSFASSLIVLTLLLVTVVVVRAVGSANPSVMSSTPAIVANESAAAPVPQTAADLVARGRSLVTNHACGLCHGGGDDPAAKGWLAGSTGPDTEFKIGPPPCGSDPKAAGCFTTRPRNLTPDEATGLGRFTERQIFNALRFGLRPEDTPDVTISSTTPGQGNFPMRPHYLAPPMPWMAWRHMPDSDLRAIAAYLKRGLKPATNKVPDSEGPPDFWAAMMIPENIGTYPAAAFPTANEQQPSAADSRARAPRTRIGPRPRLRGLPPELVAGDQGLAGRDHKPRTGVRDRPLLRRSECAVFPRPCQEPDAG
jgi:mono/diheme cytochrome c family protein